MRAAAMPSRGDAEARLAVLARELSLAEGCERTLESLRQETQHRWKMREAERDDRERFMRDELEAAEAALVVVAVGKVDARHEEVRAAVDGPGAGQQARSRSRGEDLCLATSLACSSACLSATARSPLTVRV